jgi:molybdopterin converting factor small subunit
MNTAALREQISLAHQHEASTGQLAQQLEKQLPHLHPAISLAEGDRNIVMTRFVTAYVDLVPDLLDAANDVAREAGIESQVKPVLKIAEQFFLQPPAILTGHIGLDGLLDEAYLAHRLVEEVNDLYIKHFGQPLIPADTTVANLIAHQLIGETFANQLDEAVHHAVDEMLNEDSFALESVEAYREQLKSVATEAAWKRWPCLSRKLGVELELDQSA